MARIGRAGRYDANEGTTLIVRTNLRKLREMHGLTRDEAVCRMEPPHMTAAMLAKVENGERSLTVEELSQLAVAYQVPPQAILSPWVGQQQLQTNPMSGSDYSTAAESIQRWILQCDYPPYPRVITRFGSHLEGAASAFLFSNPKNLAKLYASPDQETYAELLHASIPLVFRQARSSINNFNNDVIEWLGFDPAPLYQDFEPSPESGWHPSEIITRVEELDKSEIEINYVDDYLQRSRELKNLADGLEVGYFRETHYSTVADLDQYKDVKNELTAQLLPLERVLIAVASERDRRMRSNFK